MKQKRGKNAVLFISDHREEVFDSIDFFGHTASKSTKNMYYNPFILCLSLLIKMSYDFTLKI